MLLCRLLISRGNHEVVHNNQVSLFLICVVRWSQIILAFKIVIVDVCQRTKEGEAVWGSVKIRVCSTSELLTTLPLGLSWVCEAQWIDCDDLSFLQGGRGNHLEVQVWIRSRPNAVLEFPLVLDHRWSTALNFILY